MQKRGLFLIFFLIFVIILLPTAYSIYEEEVYSGTIEDGDTLNISGSIFEFKIDPVSKKVYVGIDFSAIILANGQCKIKDNWDICIGNINFSYRNYTTWYDVYKAKVNVYQIKSDLDITNTIENSNLLIDEETIATLVLENNADVAAEDVIAVISIPYSILVTEVEGCKKTFDSIIFEGDVHPRQIRECTYKVKGLTGDDIELIANVTYFDGIEQKDTTSNTLDVKIYNYSLKISYEMNKSRFNIGENVNLTIKIKNTNDQYDIQIKTFTIKIPEGLLLIKKPKDTSGTDRLRSWSGTLVPGENETFLIELQAIKTYNYSIPIEASYEISKFLRTTKKVSNIEVYCDCPYIHHQFSQQITAPDQRVGLKASITNPSPLHNFRNVKIDYTTNIPNIQDHSTVHSKISPFESIRIFDSPITTPNLGETYNLDIKAVYESSSGEVFVVKNNIEIKIPSADEVTDDVNASTEEIIVPEEEDISDTEKSEEISEEESTDETIPVTTLKDEGIGQGFWSSFSFKNFNFGALSGTGQDTFFSFKKMLMAFFIFAIIIVVLVVITRFGKKKVEEKQTKEKINIEEIDKELKELKGLK